MDLADKRLESLVKLTKGRSKTDRTLLYRHLAHLIIQRKNVSTNTDGKPTDDTKILFELFDALSAQVDKEIRQELAQDLARRKNPPIELTRRLALDDISIAQEILKTAPFDEKSLLNIINKTGRAHHIVIAERKDLSQKLWQTIVDKREGEKPKEPTPPEAPINKVEETPLIPFPKRPANAKGTPLRPVDLFVPSFAGGKKKTAIKEPQAENAPNYFLGTPPQNISPAQPQQTQENSHKDFIWSVDRKGVLTKADPELLEILNLKPNQLNHQSLWQLLDLSDSNDIFNAILKHHPLRDLTVKIIDSNIQFQILAHAHFDRATGRFEGYEGSFKPVPDAFNTQQSRRTPHPPTAPDISPNLPQKSQEETMAGHILAAHLSADASTPIQDMLEGIQRIARAARRNNDEAMLTDIRAVMADCFKIRDMVEDTDRIARMFGGTQTYSGEKFDVFKVLNACLEEDATRYSHAVRFQLLPQTRNPMVNFSRTILHQAFARMLELARESNKGGHPLPIYVHPTQDGRLEVAIPLGAMTGDKSIDERDLTTDDRLKLGLVHRKRSSDPVMTASLGLSALNSTIEKLGGKLEIIQNYSAGHERDMSLNGGSVSLRLPHA